MSLDTEYKRCFELFGKRDYEGCARASVPLIDTVKTHELLQIFLISLYRSGQHQFAAELTEPILEATAHDARVQSLLRLTLGLTGPAEALDQARTAKERCQAYYYIGANLLTNSYNEEALAAFQECARTGERCTEADLARLESRVPAVITPSRGAMTTEQFDWFNAKVREAGEALLEAQNPSRARDLAGEAYDRATRVLDEDSAAMGATLQLISRIYFRLGDYATARSMALEAKTLAEENLGVRHHMHIDCIEDLAGIEIAEGNEDQASALLAEKTRLLELTHTG